MKETHLFYEGNYYMGGMYGFWSIFWVLLIGGLVFFMAWVG